MSIVIMTSIELPQSAAELLGVAGCSFSAWSLGPYVACLALFISLAVRYRGAVFHQYYQKHNTRPTRYCTITAYPYEAILAFLLLAGPRIFMAKDVIAKAFAAGAWENRDLSNLSSWVFVGYFLLIDVFERVMFRRRILTPYYEMKARDSVDVIAIEQAPVSDEKRPLASAADEEAATAPPAADVSDDSTVRQSLRVRLTKLFTYKIKYPEPTAVNVLSQMHMSAFVKALFAFVFLSGVTMQVCLADHGYLENFFNLNEEDNFLPQFILVSAWMSVRFAGLVVRSVRFARREVDFAAVNGREGRLTLSLDAPQK